MIHTVRNLFFRDFWLKLFSVVLAVLIWLTVWLFAIRKEVSPTTALNNARLVESTFYNIPVLVMSGATDVRSFKVSPSTVTIKVRGEAKKIQELENKLRDDPEARDIRALVDLTGIGSVEGLRKRIAVTTPADITFELAEPDQVEIIDPTKH
ncbi:MAG: hypothetical protein U1F65_09950 [Verrucomicrobiota bacterium]